MVYRQTSSSKLQQLKLAVAAAASLSASGPSSRTPEISPQAPRSSVPLASMEQSPASCFLEAFGYDATNITPDRANSTVFILNRDDKTSMSLESLRHNASGSGFIVASSGGADGLNRIVTQQHVTNQPDGKDGKDGYLVYGSNGDWLGTAAVVADGGLKEKHDRFGGLIDDEKRGLKDAAVLAMSSFASPAMEREYRAIKGFRIAPVQSTDLLKFETLTAAPTHGASGGPIFDQKGEVVGITHSVRPDAPERIDADLANSVSYGNILLAVTTPRKFYPTLGQAFAVPTGTAYAVPLGDKKIDTALNAAGAGITKAPLTTKLSVTIEGFPLGNCSTYQGTVMADPYIPPPKGASRHRAPKAPRHG